MDSYEKLISDISALAKKVVAVCAENGYHVATAESCTGGMISAALTAVSGSSAVIELGVCSYSNRIKQEVLRVSADTLEKHTEYSTECAEEMAQGVMNAAGAEFAVSTTGVAGPTGGTEAHPVGEVCIGVCDNRPWTNSYRFLFEHDKGKDYSERDYIRAAAARRALALLLEQIESY